MSGGYDDQWDKTRQMPPQREAPRGPVINAGRLWAGGVATAIVAALAATGLAHLLLLSTPRPMAYFGWIAGLLTAVAVVLPLLNDDPIAVSLATGVIHLVIGAAITSLVTGAALSASSR